LAIALGLIHAVRSQVGTNPPAVSPSKPWPRFTTAILPFNNADGDPGLDQWRHGFADLIGRRLFSWSQRVDLVGWSELGPALTNAGWSAQLKVDAKLTRRIADELELNTVIWGKYSRTGTDWDLSITVFRTESTNQSWKLNSETRR
jgi:hypothetical protein